MRRFLSKILNNIHYKMISVILASFLWYLVQGEEILEINRKIQVNIKVPEGFMVRGGPIRFKDSTLSGSRSILSDFSSKPIEANIIIPPNKLGEMRFRIDKEYIYNWNNRIKLTVHDAYLTIFVDEKQTRSLPVKEYLQGVPADGFMLEKVTVEPTKLLITGLKADIGRLKYILTEPIDISGIQKSAVLDVSLQTKEMHLAQLSQDVVKVTLQVGEKKSNKRYEDIPIIIEGSTFQTIVKPYRVSIVTQGTPSVLSGIKNSDLRAYIDAHDLIPGKYEKKVQVKIPPELVLIESIPSVVSIEILNKAAN